jgi:hypothetical protein
MALLTQCWKAGSQDGRPGYIIKFGYDQSLIELFKQAIPSRDREWHEDKKEWWVSELHDKTLKQFFSNFESITKFQGKLF